MSVPAPVLDLPQRRSLLHAAFLSLRPRQWTKNLLLFAGIIFAAKLGDLSRWGEALAAPRRGAGGGARPLRLPARRTPRDRVDPLPLHLLRAAGVVHARPQARRAAGRDDDRRPLRRAGGRGRSGGRGSNLALASAVHGAARALPRAREAPRRARARRC